MKKTFLLLAFFTLICFCLSHCGKEKPVANTEIRLGAIAPLTGMFSAGGAAIEFGIKTAVDDINKGGGVKVGNKKIPLKLIVVNNESDPNKAGTLAENLIMLDKVHFLVSGDTPPPLHPAVANIAEREKIPYITSVGPIEPWLAMRQESLSKWKYTWATGLFSIVTPARKGDFRNKPGYTILDSWMDILEKFGNQTNKRVAIIAADDPDGKGWYLLFGEALGKLGYTVVGFDKKIGLMPLETTNFAETIKQWKEAGVEILWGNCPSAFFAPMWKQARALDFKPKIVSISKGALYYPDIATWGDDLPVGVGCELFWHPSIKNAPGIGKTTPASLAEKWANEKKQPFNPALGPAYRSVQVLIDAIERAASINPDKVVDALAKTDLKTITGRIVFDKNQFSMGPVVFAQWFKTDSPERWELRIISSKHDFIPATAKYQFPVPYK